MTKRRAPSNEETDVRDVEVAPPEVTLSSGKRVPLDGDSVFLIDRLYREFAQRHRFAPAFGDVQRELNLIIDQMPAEQRQEYFTQSLFLNYVTYENEMAERLTDEIARKGAKGTKAQSSPPK